MSDVFGITITILAILLLAGVVVLLLMLVRKVGHFAARTWVIVLSVAVPMLVFWLLVADYYHSDVVFLSLPVIGLLSGGASILIENNGIAKKSPREPAPQPSRSPTAKKHPAKTAASIFISYRRTDSADVTGRIYDYLTEHFGRTRVFKDVDSIPLGVNFKQYLIDSMAECRLLLVIIGKRWTGQEDVGARSTIEDSIDFVRIEVETALQRSVPIIPVLVQGTRMPRPADLPDSLQPLVYYNAVEVRPDPDFHSDISRLINGIEQHLR